MMKLLLNTYKAESRSKVFSLLFFLSMLFSFSSSFAQTTKKSARDKNIPIEKSILVDAKIYISMCVSEGKVKINGWERNEIRAFVKEGSAVGFEIRKMNEQTKKPLLVKIVDLDTSNDKNIGVEECLSGEEIELDVPRNATVDIKGSASETNINLVSRTLIKYVSGDIFLSNVAQGIEASTFEGDVTVENSSGVINLTTTSGNIVAFNVSPKEIGDIFKSKTSSGAITLQQLEFGQTEVTTSSGSIRFTGAVQNGGQYNFGTQNGSITLFIPPNSSGKLDASYGFGVFDSELPLKNVFKPNSSKTQSLTAVFGTGDATINLKTVSGAIRIKKQ
jgi:hypothetical protein